MGSRFQEDSASWARPSREERWKDGDGPRKLGVKKARNSSNDLNNVGEAFRKPDALRSTENTEGGLLGLFSLDPSARLAGWQAGGQIGSGSGKPCWGLLGLHGPSRSRTELVETMVVDRASRTRDQGRRLRVLCRYGEQRDESHSVEFAGGRSVQDRTAGHVIYVTCSM
jgi:hypothetical protein